MVPSRKAKLGTSSFLLFLRKGERLLPSILKNNIVRVTDCTNDAFSPSFAFLVGCVPRAQALFPCVNLGTYEIKGYRS